MSFYRISEEAFNRLERACAAASLLSSLGEGTGERMGISFEAIAATSSYIHEDISSALLDCSYSIQEPAPPEVEPTSATDGIATSNGPAMPE